MDKQLSWATLELKAAGETPSHHIIKGIASTAQTDRDGDILEPKGAEYTLPFPLLSQHKHDAPIGEVVDLKVTSHGIEIEAHIPKDSGLGYVDMAWKQIKAGLIKGLSVGFRPIDYEPMKDGGYRFVRWALHELSAVSIPANAGASILTAKSIQEFDVPSLPDQLVMPEVTESIRAKAAALLTPTPLKPAPKGVHKMNLAERIKAAEEANIGFKDQLTELTSLWKKFRRVLKKASLT